MRLAQPLSSPRVRKSSDASVPNPLASVPQCPRGSATLRTHGYRLLCAAVPELLRSSLMS